MLRHQDVWAAIDQFAADHGLSPSGLARSAGLDPTTFNKSKRVARDGRPRWPSTESIAKVLAATGATISEFVTYIGKAQGTAGVMRRLPEIALAQIAVKGSFDGSGRPAGNSWTEVPAPEIADHAAYAIQVTGDGLAPVYRAGDTLIVSPAASLRRGDRVVVHMADGEVAVRTFIRRGTKKVDLATLGAPQGERSVPVDSVAFIHRIVWASQ
jgi:phage repressor protein C with HTH and peptisase S24 domain